MTRFFASNCGSGNRATAAADPPDSHPRKPDMAAAATQSATSRWGRRPRLRRQCAHEFDTQRAPPRPPSSAVCAERSTQTNSTNTELHSRDSGSGFTEAPSSRGASETLSAPSPSEGDDLDDDILGDVSDDDLSWLDSELAPTAVCGEEQPEEVAGADDDFLSSAQAASNRAVTDRRSRARLEPPLELRVEDFECGECIGKGSYSRVFLGTHVVTGTEWALKVVSKRRTFETRENLAHLREEKNIAEKAQGSDFLVRTAGTFQNPKRSVFCSRGQGCSCRATGQVFVLFCHVVVQCVFLQSERQAQGMGVTRKGWVVQYNI